MFPRVSDAQDVCTGFPASAGLGDTITAGRVWCSGGHTAPSPGWHTVFNHSSVGGGPGFLSRCLIPTPLCLALSSAQCHQRTPEGAHKTSQAAPLRGHLAVCCGKSRLDGAPLLAGTSHTQKNAEEREAGCGESDSTIGSASDGGKRGGRGGRCRPCHSSSNLQKETDAGHVQLPSQPPSSRNHRQRSPVRQARL